MENRVDVIVAGFGDRGRAYTKYALDHPDRLRVAGVVEPNAFRRDCARNLFNIPEENCFESVGPCAARGKFCDAVIVTTMDALHVETAMPFLKLGYDMLLEKPITDNAADLLSLRDCAEEHGCKLMICHVLRYTPFYMGIKKIVASGEIGRVFHIDTSEMVGVAHASASYIRGKWGVRGTCGSSMLLAKCCHDLDLLCWLMSGTAPISVASEGGRYYFIPENAPAGSGTRCLVDCPLEEGCIYSCRKLALDNHYFPQYLWAGIDKDPKDISEEEKIASLMSDNPQGRCIWKTDSDIVDRQALVMKFADGTTAVHSMISGAARPGRKIHIVGSLGEIDGFLEDNSFKVRLYRASDCLYSEREEVITGVTEGDGHSGGDSRIVQDFVRTVTGEPCSVSSTVIGDSVNGHLTVYAADLSMEEGRVVKLSEFFEEAGAKRP